MRKALSTLSLLTAAITLVAAPVQAKQKLQGVKGQVIKVEQRVRTENDAEFDRLTIRTRQGEEMRLHLGHAGECPDCYEVGDRVRARIHAAAKSGGDCVVQSMKLRRTGRQLHFALENGKMVQLHKRGHHGRHHARQFASGGSGGRGKGK